MSTVPPAAHTVPPVTHTTISNDELRAQVEAWKQGHPGFDETNFADAFRDESGELIEDDEFFEAVQLFALFESLPK